MKLIGLVGQQGYTLIPLRLYFSKAMVKVEIVSAKEKNYMINARLMLGVRRSGTWSVFARTKAVVNKNMGA